MKIEYVGQSAMLLGGISVTYLQFTLHASREARGKSVLFVLEPKAHQHVLHNIMSAKLGDTFQCSK